MSTKIWPQNPTGFGPERTIKPIGIIIFQKHVVKLKMGTSILVHFQSLET